MSPWLVALTGLIYLYIAAEQMWLGHVPMSITYFGYALANVGLYVLARSGG